MIPLFMSSEPAEEILQFSIQRHCIALTWFIHNSWENTEKFLLIIKFFCWSSIILLVSLITIFCSTKAVLLLHIMFRIEWKKTYLSKLFILPWNWQYQFAYTSLYIICNYIVISIGKQLTHFLFSFTKRQVKTLI